MKPSARQQQRFDEFMQRRFRELREAFRKDIEAKLAAETKEIAARALAATRKIAATVDQAVNRALDRLDKQGGGSAEEVRELRRRLEAGEGATSGAAKVSPILPLIPHPGAKVAALLVAGTLGYMEGASRDENRQRALRAAEIEDARGIALDEALSEASDTVERLRAARRRARLRGRG